MSLYPRLDDLLELRHATHTLGLSSRHLVNSSFTGLYASVFRGVTTAVVVSSLLFSLLHGILWLAPALFVVGMILALVYEKSGSLWVAVLVHGLFNSAGVIAVYGAVAKGIPLT